MNTNLPTVQPANRISNIEKKITYLMIRYSVMSIVKKLGFFSIISTNTLGKGMNLIIPPPAMGK